MSIQPIIFYSFSLLVILAGSMMIFSRNPVKSALFLVLAFFGTAALWLMLEAEFLSLILIFVYVGAVMTLFLFAVMMINLQPEKLRGGFVRYLPIALLLSAIMVGLMVYVIKPSHLMIEHTAQQSANDSNIASLGEILYTDYAYPFELVAVLLLIAMIAAVSLTHRRRLTLSKSQDVGTQLKANKADRLRRINMPSEPNMRDE